MITLLILLALGLVSADKLDRTYLPPPGSNFSGGSPGDLQVPFEYPKEAYSTSAPIYDLKQDNVSPGDLQLVPGNQRIPGPSYQGPQDSISVTPGNKLPFNYFQNTYKLPTTTTSYAFTQTTTFPPIEGFETTVNPISPGFPIDGIPNIQTGGINQLIDQGQKNNQPPGLPFIEVQPTRPPQNIRPGDVAIIPGSQLYGPNGQVIVDQSGTQQFTPPGSQAYGSTSQFSNIGNNDSSKQPQGPNQQNFPTSTTSSPYIESVTSGNPPFSNNQKYSPHSGVQPPQQYIHQGYSSSTPPPQYQLNVPSPTNFNSYGNIPGIVYPQSNEQLEQTQSHIPISPSTSSQNQYVDKYGNIQNITPAITYSPNVSQFPGSFLPSPGTIVPSQHGIQSQFFPDQQNRLTGNDFQTIIPGLSYQQPGRINAPQVNYTSSQFSQGGNIPYSDLLPSYQQNTNAQSNIQQGFSAVRPQQSLVSQPTNIPISQSAGLQTPFNQPNLTPTQNFQPLVQDFSTGQTVSTYGPNAQLRGDQGNKLRSFSNFSSPNSTPESNFGPFTTTLSGEQQYYQPGTSSTIFSQNIPDSKIVMPQPNLHIKQQNFNQNSHIPTQNHQSGILKPNSVLPSNLNQQVPVSNKIQPDFEFNKPNQQVYFPSTTPGSIVSSTSSSTAVFGSQYPKEQVTISLRSRADTDRNAVILNYVSALNPEGYAYTFDTSNGIHADENGTTINGTRANGSYSYIGDDGKVYSVEYSADENGFRPRGDHIPTPPPIPEAIQRVIEQAKKDQEAGIHHTGYYDDSKYGHKKYQRPKNRGPQLNNKYDTVTENDAKEISNSTLIGDEDKEPLYSEQNSKNKNRNDYGSQIKETQSNKTSMRRTKPIPNIFVKNRNGEKTLEQTSSLRNQPESKYENQKMKEKYKPERQYENEEVSGGAKNDQRKTAYINQRPHSTSSTKGQKYLPSEKRKYLPNILYSMNIKNLNANQDYDHQDDLDNGDSDTLNENNFNESDEINLDEYGEYELETASKRPFRIQSHLSKEKHRELDLNNNLKNSHIFKVKKPHNTKYYNNEAQENITHASEETSSEPEKISEYKPDDETSYEENIKIGSTQRQKPQKIRHPDTQSRYRTNLTSKLKVPYADQDNKESDRNKQDNNLKVTKTGTNTKSSKNKIINQKPNYTTPSILLDQDHNRNLEKQDSAALDKHYGNVYKNSQELSDEDEGYYYTPPMNRFNQISNKFPSRFSENAKTSSSKKPTTVQPFITPNVARFGENDQDESSETDTSKTYKNEKLRPPTTQDSITYDYGETSDIDAYEDEESSGLNQNIPMEIKHQRPNSKDKVFEYTDNSYQTTFDEPSRPNNQFLAKTKKPGQRVIQENRKTLSTTPVYYDDSYETTDDNGKFTQGTPSHPDYTGSSNRESIFDISMPSRKPSTNKTSAYYTTQPTYQYTDKDNFPGSPTIRPGLSESAFSRPSGGNRRPSSKSQQRDSVKIPGDISTFNGSDYSSRLVTGRPGINKLGQESVPSTTYRPNHFITEVTQPSRTSTDAFGRPITEANDFNQPDYTGPDSTDHTASIQQPGFASTFQPSAQRFGVPSQEYPGAKPAEFGPSAVTTPGYLGPTRGEDFSGPKQPQKFDPQTGYYY